jgi:hypothetical protein
MLSLCRVIGVAFVLYAARAKRRVEREWIDGASRAWLDAAPPDMD